MQSDFEHYGDNLPVGPNAALWGILRDVVAIGSPNGAVSQNVWNLLTSLTRPVVRERDGTQFTRLHGIAMGTPLVPILANLAVVPMDRAILDINGIFYARYNDDFLIAPSGPRGGAEADARVDALLGQLGVARKLQKECRTALAAMACPRPRTPPMAADRIDSLGLSVTHAGTLSLAPHRLRRFVGRIATRLDGAAPALAGLPANGRARELVAAANVMLDVNNPFAVSGLASLLDSTTDRDALKDLDFRVVRADRPGRHRPAGVRGTGWYRQPSCIATWAWCHW